MADKKQASAAKVLSEDNQLLGGKKEGEDGYNELLEDNEAFPSQLELDVDDGEGD